MSTPSITPAQILATLSSVLGLLVTQGLVTNHTEKLVGGLASILIPVAWQIADAVIRHGRAKIVVAQANLAASAASAEAWQAANAAKAPAAAKPRSRTSTKKA